MLDSSYIKPIPQYMAARIRTLDRIRAEQNARTRFYAYLTKQKGVLLKVTVAVKTYKHKWYCKQVAVHGLHENHSLAKDIVRSYLSGYYADWHEELGVNHYYSEHTWSIELKKDWDPWAPIVNMDYLGRFPEYKYSGYELFTGSKILQFLECYEEYPQIEYLMKLGLTDLWESKRICTLLSKDKAFCRWIIRNRDEINAHWYNKTTIINAYRRNRTIPEQRKIENELSPIHNRGCKGVCRAFKGETEQFKLLHYLKKTGIGLNTYWDYYQACVELGLDMNDTKNRFPHDFKHWHDVRIDQRKAKQRELDAEKRKEFYTQFAEAIAKYIPLEHVGNDGYAVIIAQSPGQLLAEGEALHHCVGKMGYDKKVVDGQSLIFFVRRADKLDEPFVTMEYSPKTHKVLQLYGKGNTRPSEEVQNYIYKKWLPQANKTLRRIAA